MLKTLLTYAGLIVVGWLAPQSPVQGQNRAYSDIASDETVVFFRTTAWLNTATDEWHVPIHGWIYEPEASIVRKAAFAAILESQYSLEISPSSEDNFSRRLNLLIADNERNKRIVIEIAGQTHTLRSSGENGHFETILRIDAASARPYIEDAVMTYAAVTREGEPRRFSGDVTFIAPSGLSIISDIDDTVKVSNVVDRRKLLESTFLLDFAAVPGMADIYREWAEHDAAFHFVSSSPWQLYAPLQEFLDQNGFPRAELNLKAVRFRDDTLFDLFREGTETKPPLIERILTSYPDRSFVLVGDSGEQDPEVYADFLRRYPDQIRKIFIRNVTRESPDNERFSRVFGGLDKERWQLFDEPAAIDSAMLLFQE